MKLRLLSLVLLLFVFCVPANAQVDISKIRVDTTPVKNEKDLVNQSTLVVYGWPNSADEEYPTGQTVEQFKLVNFVQTFHVKQSLKGTSSPLIRIVTTGTDPLPKPPNPLNKVYPGPLAEGNYLCFLRKLPGTDLYTIVGGWQGVYPYLDGKFIALQDSGFPKFHGLTIQQAEQLIKQM
ncbi:hypothetical protein [Ammoniphilus sp. 3BR4]|uniref:hypothetical protein n=1 Tax=Ammoniphilus sp. 3BR4 TaxID=3158265 RepID=UPI003466FBF4